MKRIEAFLRVPFFFALTVVVYYAKRIFHMALNAEDKNRIFIFGSVIEHGARLHGIDDRGCWISFRKQGFGPMYLRHRPSSDWDVFRQVIENKQYEKFAEAGLQIQKDDNHLNILDGGANIGLTALYLLSIFPQAKIVSVEPDPENFQILSGVLARQKSPLICAMQAGLWSCDTLLKVENNFRDGRAWARIVAPDPDGTIRAWTVSSLMAHLCWSHIDLLKLDVEGAEFEIFRRDADLSFLDKVSCVAIEIHHEKGKKSDITDILTKFKFDIIDDGELTIGIKSGTLKP